MLELANPYLPALRDAHYITRTSSMFFVCIIRMYNGEYSYVNYIFFSI